MEKYIKANTVLNFINGCLEHEDKITDTEKAVLTGVKTCVERIPTADVVEVRHGQWENLQGNKYHERDMRILRCSLCRNFLDMSGVNAGRGDANYCPNCGAKMDGE